MSELRSQSSELECPSASELRRMPIDERMAILRAQAAIAEKSYRHDRELTSFEAFGEDDLYCDAGMVEPLCLGLDLAAIDRSGD